MRHEHPPERGMASSYSSGASAAASTTDASAAAGIPADVAVPFFIRVLHERGRTRLCLVGELDLTGVPRLASRVDQMLTAQPQINTVTVELSGLDFVDAAGARGLLLACQRLRDNHWGVDIVGMQPGVARVVDLVRVAQQRDGQRDMDR
jgi:anti-anti-sigma factor